MKRFTYKNKVDNRTFRKIRVRKKISGTDIRPRVSVTRTNRHMFVQVIDDLKGHTIVSVSTLEKGIKDHIINNKCNKTDTASYISNILVKRMKEKDITDTVFDRSGCKYHGRVKIIAESLRENNLCN